MDDVKIIVIGDEKGVRDVYRSVKYPQLIGTAYVYNKNFIFKESSDFFDGYEIIVLAFELESLTHKIKHLTEVYFGNKGVIILDYYKLRRMTTPSMVADAYMQTPNVSYYDGVIMGISHAEVGIIPERLKNGKFVNLAVSSQDIYYNYKNLEYCYYNYFNKLSRIHTVIFDMYDYSYFNYDVSITKRIIRYLSSGGFNRDKHNFDKNIDYPDYSYQQMIEAVRNQLYEYEYKENIETWDMIFTKDLGKLYGEDYFQSYDQRYRFEVVRDEEVNSWHIGRYTKEVFDDTLKENRLYFEKIFELLYKINPNLEIYLTLLPRYAGVWDKEEEMRTLWKDYFFGELDRLKEKYSFCILDYSRDDIARNKSYYYDCAHFNFLGAMKFTDMLNDAIS